MSLREYLWLLDAPVLWHPGRGVWVPVTVKDLRTAYGRVDALIAPKGGKGETWVNADELREVK